ncbi:Hypothetical_protein [Hexamita inflata]|uniref:Hypothetical_protein n=1 Tax=Hexamita inflata TaxID=28002 RepID=A0ABP1JU56_9EUKA
MNNKYFETSKIFIVLRALVMQLQFVSRFTSLLCYNFEQLKIKKSFQVMIQIKRRCLYYYIIFGYVHRQQLKQQKFCKRSKYCCYFLRNLYKFKLVEGQWKFKNTQLMLSSYQKKITRKIYIHFTISVLVQ